MGCVGSKLWNVRNWSFAGSRRNSLRRQNVFPVLNVDDMGRQISPGKIEVTETDLVLHVRGKPSLTWPLRCLRRYGYDNDLFSFESGRRCPTGAGIFAFKCGRAQSLFNLLQSKIQGNPGTTPNTVPSTPITPTNTTCSNNPSTPNSSTFVYVNLSENNRSTTNAPDVTQVHVPNSQTVPASLNSIGICSSSSTSFPLSQSYKLLENNCHPLYMNVDAPALPYHNTVTTRSASISYPSQKSQYYMNLERKNSGQQLSYRNNDNSANESILYTNVVCPPKSEKTPLTYFVVPEPAEVNYAELDLKTDNCSSSSTNPLFPSASKNRFPLGKENEKYTSSDSKFRLKFGKPAPIPIGDPTLPRKSLVGATSYGVGSPPPNVGEMGYATIDFDRTAALSVVTRSKINLDFYTFGGSGGHHDARKTRHNSTAL